MEKKYSIAVLFLMIILIIGLSFGYRKEYDYLENQSMSTQGTAGKEQVFYLKNLNGYVVVFHEDEKVIYEYTDIRVEDLPNEIQKEIEQTKKITGVNKLYGFLENYSS